MKRQSLLLVPLLLAVTFAAQAASYQAPVTRKGNNLYQVDGQALFVVTQNCRLLAYAEMAVLETTRTGGQTGGHMRLLYSKDACDLKGVYSPKVSAPGRYSVTISHKAENWYEIFGTPTFVRTIDCRVLVLAQEAFLSISVAGVGKITFKDGDICKVEAIFSKRRL